jgi:hypothetical protein
MSIARVENRHTKMRRRESTLEICGPAFTIGGLGLLLVLAVLIPA